MCPYRDPDQTQKEIRMNAVAQQTSGDNTAIRPFQVNVPEAKIAKLRSRIDATEWPDRETVADESQGVQLATMQELARYWATEYDWRKCEAKLNSLPNFMTEIDGLDIHFIHVRSKHENALPLIVTHGWPGSVIELLKIIDPLNNPTAHGANASDAFHLVIPSLPGSSDRLSSSVVLLLWPASIVALIDPKTVWSQVITGMFTFGANFLLYGLIGLSVGYSVYKIRSLTRTH
jgi:hypothetical protein